jgi:hypothetical protein
VSTGKHLPYSSSLRKDQVELLVLPSPCMYVQVHSEEARRRIVKNVMCAFCAYFSPRCATCASFATAQPNYYPSLFPHPLLLHFVFLNLFNIFALLSVPFCVSRRASEPFYIDLFQTRLPLSRCMSRDSRLHRQIENLLGPHPVF